MLALLLVDTPIRAIFSAGAVIVVLFLSLSFFPFYTGRFPSAIIKHGGCMAIQFAKQQSVSKSRRCGAL